MMTNISERISLNVNLELFAEYSVRFVFSMIAGSGLLICSFIFASIWNIFHIEDVDLKIFLMFFGIYMLSCILTSGVGTIEGYKRLKINVKNLDVEKVLIT